MSAARRRRQRGRSVARLAAGLLAAGLLVGACSGSEPTPAEARRDRVETRLRSTFSKAQSDCILDRVDDDVLQVLDRSAELAADSPELEAYSGAVTSCVADPDGTTTTVADPVTTTSAPAGTTTQPGDPAPDVEGAPSTTAAGPTSTTAAG